MEKVVKMKRPLITFYMRAYNAEKYIQRAITSILNQSLGDIEFILVNNASTDRTGEICRYYADKDIRIKYNENEKNTFLYPEYKAKWIHPKGEYYSFVDADDYIHIDFAKIMYEAGSKYKADIVISGTETFKDTIPNSKSVRIPPAAETKSIYDIACNIEEFYGSLRTIWGKLYRTEFYLEHIKYANDRPRWLKSGADTFAVLRYLRKCKSFVSVDKALYYYRIHENSLYNKNVSVSRVFEAKCLYEEGADLLRQFDAATEKNISFLQDVHLASITDCMENAVKNTSASLKGRLMVMQAITTDDFFCSYALLDRNRSTIFDAIGACTRAIISGVDAVDQAKAGDFFISRIYRSLHDGNLIKDRGSSTLLLSAICDSENKHFWGIDCLEQLKLFMPRVFNQITEEVPDILFYLLKDKKLLREILNGECRDALKNIEKKENKGPSFQRLCEILKLYLLESDNKNLLDTKKKLINCLDNGDMESAIKYLSKITDNHILDREGIYFKIYISWQLGDKAIAIDIAEIAAVFWDDDSDIMAICGDVLAAIDAYDRAKWFYVKAVEKSNDKGFVEDICKRIDDLSF